MMFNSDALMIGLVCFLLFGAIALYLYMYLQQVDQKVNLLESILLDMKVSNEIKSFEVSPDDHSYVPFKENTVDIKEVSEELTPFVDPEEVEDTVIETDAPDTYSPMDSTVEELQPLLNYETATLKELQAVAKSKGISVSNVKKSQLIEALKGLEQSGLDAGVTGSSSFLETSAPVSNEP
jgi:hypothetical protein